jgi:hypothetical protein
MGRLQLPRWPDVHLAGQNLTLLGGPLVRAKVSGEGLAELKRYAFSGDPHGVYGIYQGVRRRLKQVS